MGIGSHSCRSLFASCSALLVSAALVACDPPEPDAPETRWPAGTVLAVDELAITADEVDLATAWVRPIQPGATDPQLRRLALSNVVLPRAVAQLLAPSERLEAKRKADELLAAIQGGTPPAADAVQPVSGNWQVVGIPAWGTALALEDGGWSGVVEAPGEFLVLRRLALHPAPQPLSIVLDLELARFPYLDQETAGGAIERAYDERRLTIVDPAWREVVPELIQYRMGAVPR